MNHIETMKQALDALENVRQYDSENLYGLDDEITALRQAIEQTEDVEPFAVAWAMDGELFWPSEYEVIAQEGDGAQPLYTAPPQREWQGLTEDEVSAAVDDCDVYFDDEFLVNFARRIEAKLKEKNGF